MRKASPSIQPELLRSKIKENKQGKSNSRRFALKVVVSLTMWLVEIEDF